MAVDVSLLAPSFLTEVAHIEMSLLAPQFMTEVGTIEIALLAPSFLASDEPVPVTPNGRRQILSTF